MQPLPDPSVGVPLAQDGLVVAVSHQSDQLASKLQEWHTTGTPLHRRAPPNDLFDNSPHGLVPDPLRVVPGVVCAVVM